jgi:hypothetical protein
MWLRVFGRIDKRQLYNEQYGVTREALFVNEVGLLPQADSLGTTLLKTGDLSYGIVVSQTASHAARNRLSSVIGRLRPRPLAGLSHLQIELRPRKRVNQQHNQQRKYSCEWACSLKTGTEKLG